MLSHENPQPSLGHITVLGQVIHQNWGEQPVPISWGWSRPLATNEAMYQRRMEVGEEPIEIDTGWLRDTEIGYVCIHNLEGTSLLKIPTKEEKRNISERVVLVGDSISIAPGMVEGFVPQKKLPRIRCLKGKAKITISIIPA